MREAAEWEHALRTQRSEARDLTDDADAEDDRVSRARGAAAAAYERALPARRRVASLQSELRDQCGCLTEDGPLAVADASELEAILRRAHERGEKVRPVGRALSPNGLGRSTDQRTQGRWTLPALYRPPP